MTAPPNSSCPIWNVPCIVSQPDSDTYVVENSFRAGGGYQLTWDARFDIEGLSPSEKARLTSWLIEQRRAGDKFPRVTRSEVEHACARQVLPVAERAERLLQFLVMSSPRIGSPLELAPSGGGSSPAPDYSETDQLEFAIYQSAMAWSESTTGAELDFLMDYLAYQGSIAKGTPLKTDRRMWYTSSNVPGAYLCMVQLPGYSRVEEITTGIELDRCFVAMWFDPSMNHVYDHGISPAIRAAGYDPRRIDRQDDLIGKIDDAIVSEIKRSRFLVADFTHGDSGARGGVYYEAGLAHGIGIPVIFLCRHDVIKEVHFDTRQFNHIVWDDVDELATRLTDRILASIGEGPHMAT